jgi:hypothetical protein
MAEAEQERRMATAAEQIARFLAAGATRAPTDVTNEILREAPVPDGRVSAEQLRINPAFPALTTARFRLMPTPQRATAAAEENLAAAQLATRQRCSENMEVFVHLHNILLKYRNDAKTSFLQRLWSAVANELHKIDMARAQAHQTALSATERNELWFERRRQKGKSLSALQRPVTHLYSTTRDGMGPWIRHLEAAELQFLSSMAQASDATIYHSSYDDLRRCEAHLLCAIRWYQDAWSQAIRLMNNWTDLNQTPQHELSEVIRVLNTAIQRFEGFEDRMINELGCPLWPHLSLPSFAREQARKMYDADKANRAYLIQQAAATHAGQR